MKRVLRILSGFTIVAANLAAAVYVVILTTPFTDGMDWMALIARLGYRRWLVFMAAILYFLLWMLYFWAGRRNRPRERFLMFEGDQGPVSISTLAMSDFLMRLATEFPSITRIEPRVLPRRGAVDVLLNIRVKAGTQVNELCHALQQRVRQSLIEEMGIPEVNHINVNIGGITGEHRIT